MQNHRSMQMCRLLSITWVWRRVSPLIQRICPVLFTSWEMEPLDVSSTSDPPASRSSGLPEPHVNVLGIFFVGMLVMHWPHTSTPAPKNRHHSHWSKDSGAVEKARPPNWTIITCTILKELFTFLSAKTIYIPAQISLVWKSRNF